MKWVLRRLQYAGKSGSSPCPGLPDGTLWFERGFAKVILEGAAAKKFSRWLQSGDPILGSDYELIPDAEPAGTGGPVVRERMAVTDLEGAPPNTSPEPKAYVPFNEALSLAHVVPKNLKSLVLAGKIRTIRTEDGKERYHSADCLKEALK